MKKEFKIISSLLIAGFFVLMFLTNPDRASVHKKIKEKEGFFSIVHVSKRINCLLFSFYDVNILSVKREPEQYLYLGILGQVIELN